MDLISFKLCPYVQQVAILLRQKKIDFDLKYIDLADPPNWFLDISPLKKVPVLVVENHVLFDSIAISEFIEERFPRRLHPENAFERANHRAWIQFINSLTWSAFNLSVAETSLDLEKEITNLHEKLDEFETAIIGDYFFNGKDLSVPDSLIAPFYQRLDYLNLLHQGILSEARHPKFVSVGRHLLSLDVVKSSYVPELKELYYQLLGKRKGYISMSLDPKYRSEDGEKSIY